MAGVAAGVKSKVEVNTVCLETIEEVTCLRQRVYGEKDRLGQESWDHIERKHWTCFKTVAT